MDIARAQIIGPYLLWIGHKNVRQVCNTRMRPHHLAIAIYLFCSMVILAMCVCVSVFVVVRSFRLHSRSTHNMHTLKVTSHLFKSIATNNTKHVQPNSTDRAQFVQAARTHQWKSRPRRGFADRKQRARAAQANARITNVRISKIYHASCMN